GSSPHLPHGRYQALAATTAIWYVAAAPEALATRRRSPVLAVTEPRPDAPGSATKRKAPGPMTGAAASNAASALLPPPTESAVALGLAPGRRGLLMIRTALILAGVNAPPKASVIEPARSIVSVAALATVRSSTQILSALFAPVPS